MTNGREKSDPAMSHREADEQGGAIRCGAGGGRGKCGPAQHAPGAGPGKRVTGAGPHRASCKAKEGGEVHGALPPSQHRPARSRLRRTRRGRRCGRRRSDMDGVRGEPRAQPRGPARPSSPGSVPGAAEPAGVHPEAGWPTTPACGRRSRRQDRPEGDSRGAERGLRGRLPRILLRVPTRARGARCARRARCRVRARGRRPALLGCDA